MTREETQELMHVVRVTYPAFYKDADRATLTQALDIWAACLGELDYKFVQAAFVEHVRKSKFAPTIAELREIAEDKQQQEAFYQRVRLQTQRRLERQRQMQLRADNETKQ